MIFPSSCFYHLWIINWQISQQTSKTNMQRKSLTRGTVIAAFFAEGILMFFAFQSQAISNSDRQQQEQNRRKMQVETYSYHSAALLPQQNSDGGELLEKRFCAAAEQNKFICQCWEIPSMCSTPPPFSRTPQTYFLQIATQIFIGRKTACWKEAWDFCP